MVINLALVSPPFSFYISFLFLFLFLFLFDIFYFCPITSHLWFSTHMHANNKKKKSNFHKITQAHAKLMGSHLFGEENSWVKKKLQNRINCKIYFLVMVEPPPNLSEITGRLLNRNAILNFFVGKPQKSGQKHHGTCLDEKILKLQSYLERFVHTVREMCTN